MDQRQTMRRRRRELGMLLWAQLGALIGFGALVFIIYQLYQVFQPFVTPIAWAIILGLTFQPVHRGIRGMVRNRPTLAALLATGVVILTVVVPTLALSGILTQEAVGAVLQIRRFVQAGGIERWGEELRTVAWIPLWEWLSPWIGPLAVDLKGMLVRVLNGLADFVVDQVTVVATNLLIVVVKFMLMLLTLFFVFRDGEACYHWVRTTIPLSAAQQGRLFDRLAETVTAVTYGIGGAAVSQGILAGIFYWLLGVPFPAFWGLLTALVAPIPVGGTGLIWVPASIYLIAAESWAHGVTLLILGASVVSTIDNVIKTWLISERAQLPILFIFFAILGGLRVYGVLGVFLGPLLLALAITGLSLYREMSQETRSPPPS